MIGRQISFATADHGFVEDLKTSVDAYFRENNLSRKGNPQLYFKAFLFIPLAMTSYCLLLWSSCSPATDLFLVLVLTGCLIGIAFNVMHDACHGSYSGRATINNWMSLSMNALGGNAFLWKITHNIIHHTYTNIDGVDHDITHWPVLRQCPSQPWRPFHRLQYGYMFLLYALNTLAWMLVFDFVKYFSRQIAATPIERISTLEHLLFWLSKLLYILFYIALPIYVKGWAFWLTGFAILHVTFGLVVTLVFQLAHLVEKTSFGVAGNKPKQILTSWAVHELMTTANFAPTNKPLNWFLGGLNFQIEHHLFPQVSHIHYPSLSKIVKDKCEQFHLPYHCYPTVRSAITSHIRLMRQFGSKKP